MTAITRLRRRNARRGVATVELAVCLPLITLFVLGTIEAANAIFVQQALTSAAYEGANVASAVGSSSQKATAAANQVLAAMGVSSATVTITPQVTPQTQVGTHVQVTCSAPLASNMIVFGVLPLGNLSATVHMTRL